MKLIIDQQAMELKNERSAIDYIYTCIKEKLDQSDKKFSHMILDGQEIYEDFEDEIVEQINTLENVEIVFLTLKELMNETYLTGESYLARALPEIKATVDLFYQGGIEQAWDNLEQILFALQWIDQLVESIEKSEHQPTNWNDYLIIITSIRAELVQLEEGIRLKDNILIADILNYELVPALENLKETFTKSIDLEGERRNAN
ncbi:hypothetical protein [Paraliobacillus salinarum]|uniref:hypothetical protein n=1 Tax=Paraliobacillus salinarum TaxID=1158996 RepID=UPI0015F38988|nr:hypothetical protein [Paraliobacillus salinarum]